MYPPAVKVACIAFESWGSDVCPPLFRSIRVGWLGFAESQGLALSLHRPRLFRVSCHLPPVLCYMCFTQGLMGQRGYRQSRACVVSSSLGGRDVVCVVGFRGVDRYRKYYSPSSANGYRFLMREESVILLLI
jgi:hypothetical protein